MVGPPFISLSLGRHRLYLFTPLHVVVKAEAQGVQSLGEVLKVMGPKQHCLSLKVLAFHLGGRGGFMYSLISCHLRNAF